ncbi:type I endonuclease-methyltransferase fusion protein [Bacteroidia bacterium]|nr:type I endonuclease-methyltransferase fusion protein [Bacteroidia bacterium]
MNSDTKSILQALNLAEYKHNLFSVDMTYTDKRLEFYKNQAIIVKADYFYCFSNFAENQPIPFLYIYDQREEVKKEEVDLVEINKKLWTLGEIALAIVVYDEGFKVIDTRHPIKSESEPAFLDGISKAIRRVDGILKYRIFEGRILEESPADYVSVSPYQKLLDHIEKAILNRSKKIGCHQDLLKKLLVKFILIKYLEEQVDEEGNSVFENGFFDKFIFRNNATLFDKKNSFCDVLRGNNIVSLLSFLNTKFNGGIFNLSEQEESEIKRANLYIIADALDGDKDIDGQMSIWRYYDFNLLPIEFISRLYERFVTSVEGKQKSTGAYYTPPHLARLLIDELLPFEKDINFKDFKILDPSCGSGIFLVLAYKRLITLWMLGNNKQTIRGEEDIKSIKEILSDCIYGVDINEDALSITATSLQIELSSHIRPKEIWENLTFDNLETQGNLTNVGFFKWYKSTPAKYDIIAGNPPFNISKEEQKKNISLGKDDDLLEERYKDYKEKIQPFPYNNPALIFLYQCLTRLLKESKGTLFMIMPSSSFLYMPSSSEYRKSVVHYWNVERIYDFTPLMNHLWGRKKVATIAIKISNKPFAKKTKIEHIIVRNSSANERGAIRFQVDQYDKFQVPIDFIYSKDYVWKINLLGGGYLKLFFEKYQNQYIRIEDFRKNKGWKKSNGSREDASSDKQIDMYGMEILNSDFFISDKITKNMITTEESHVFRRPIPDNISNAPNIFIRLNINHQVPIVYNDKYNVYFRPGVLGLKGESNQLMKQFVSLFIENRNIYMLLIKASSPKIYIQQSDSYTIDGNDILSLPINIDEEGNPISFEPMSNIEKVIMEDTALLSDNLNDPDSSIFKKIDTNALFEYSEAFCEVLNLTYKTNGYKFISTQQIIDNDYVWVTFEHTNQSKALKIAFTNQSKLEFDKILYDEISNNALTINKIITYYGKDNQISFIKPNKLKYWMRTIAYRDAENVKSDMFKNGY